MTGWWFGNPTASFDISARNTARVGFGTPPPRPDPWQTGGSTGALPRPSADIYTKLELEYNILFKHILILLENIEKLKEYSEKREKEDGKPTTELVQFDDNDNVVPALSYLENYKWRERTKDLYDEVIYN